MSLHNHKVDSTNEIPQEKFHLPPRTNVYIQSTLTRYKFLEDNIESRLLGWRSRCLLWVNRCTLIKLLAQVIPNYSTVTFDIST